MIKLAAQTNDTTPLIQAVEALNKAKTYYKIDTAPKEALIVQCALADTTLKAGPEKTVTARRLKVLSKRIAGPLPWPLSSETKPVGRI